MARLMPKMEQRPQLRVVIVRYPTGKDVKDAVMSSWFVRRQALHK